MTVKTPVIILVSSPLTKLLEGSEEELWAHPEPPGGADVGDNLHLRQNRLYQCSSVQ